MNYLNKIKNVFSRKDYGGSSRGNSRNKYINSIMKIFGFRDFSFSEINRENLVKLYSGGKDANPVVYSLISKRADITAEVMRYAQVVDIKTNRVIDDHPVMRYLDRANYLENTRDKLIKALSINYDIFGDAFMYRKNVSLIYDKSELYPLPGQMVNIKEGGLLNPIKGFEINGLYSSKTVMGTDEVMFMRRYNPNIENGYYGLSPLATATRLLQLLESGDKNILKVYENGGVKALVSVKPSEFGNTPDQLENLENDINNADKYNHKSKIIQIPVEVQQMGTNMVDLDLINTSKYSIQVLCFVYDYPYELFLGEAKYSNQKEAKKQKYTQIGIPQAEEFCQAFTEFFKLKDEGKKIVINYDDIEALREDPNSILDAHTKARTSVNERRRVLNLEPLKGKEWDLPMMLASDMLGYEDVEPVGDGNEED